MPTLSATPHRKMNSERSGLVAECLGAVDVGRDHTRYRTSVSVPSMQDTM